MRRILIIPDRTDMEATLELVKSSSVGFEYNDFFSPSILDDERKVEEICKEYQKYALPEFCTIHGAFFDVFPCSVDEKIREISTYRIEQSIQAAKRIGALAVVFHTNYNPFLNSHEYIENWIKQNAGFWNSILRKHKDINIYLENMFDLSPDILVELSKHLCKHENYGICFDYAHAVLSKTAPEIWAKSLGKYVKHIHINDNNLVSDLHQAWGDGQINRQIFYECYEKYMSEASVLIETSSLKNKIRSLEVLKKDGFFV